MIATNHDRRFDLAAFHQFVHRHAEFGALSVTEPANPRGQSLIMNSLLREFHPARERFVFGKQFESEFVSARDILRFATQPEPAKRTTSFAEERTNVFWNETWNIERVLHAGFLRLRANIVAVIKCDRALLLQREHRFDMRRHRLHRTLD